MYGCVYFPEDNTLSVLKNGSKNVRCVEHFDKGSRCELKWKGEMFGGTIVAVGDKEAELKKTMHRLLKDVLNVMNPDEDPLPKLLAADGTEASTVSDVLPKLPKSAKKRKLMSNSNKSYNEMVDHGTSLLDTWNVINRKERNFTPSSELLDILRSLTKPSIQLEIQEMLQHFETQPEKTYTDLDTTPVLQEQLYKSFLDDLSDLPSNTTPFALTTTENAPSILSKSCPISEPVIPQSNEQTFHPHVPPPNTNASSFVIPPPSAPAPPPFIPPSNNQVSSMALSNYNTQTENTTSEESRAFATPPRLPATTSLSPFPDYGSPINSSPSNQNAIASITPLSVPLRRSPRKNKDPLMTTPDDTVTLMDDVVIQRSIMRASCGAAQKNDKPCYTLMGKLLTGVFTAMELANSKGLGIAATNVDDTRPPLDAKKVKACKEYVIGWARGRGLETPMEKILNSAVTEQISYARKKVKKQLKSTQNI